MAHGLHDTIAYRLSQILIKLNQGDHLSPDELAEEFGVHVRTIQRDLKVRLAYLPLNKSRGRYQLDASYLGKLNYKDIERFASKVGVNGLFPQLDRNVIKDLLDEQRGDLPWLVRGHHFEDLTFQKRVFTQLEVARRQRQLTSLVLQKDGQPRSYHGVHPYRLINVKGIWYLAAVHGGKLKTFGVGKILSVDLQPETFVQVPEIKTAVTTEGGIWQSEHSYKVVVSVAAEAATYFRRRQLIPHQRIVSEAADGTLTIEATVGHPNQILPIVRYWIPSVRIEEPRAWQQALNEGLCEYLAPNTERPVNCADRPILTTIVN
jgi:predicted DNA-binding transcriptional regulator YafY